MKTINAIIGIIYVMAIACCIAIGLDSDSYAKPKDTGGVTKTKPIEQQNVAATQPAVAQKNDYCEIALPVAPKEITPKAEWKCELLYKTFSSGKSVDDWYAYTTTQDSVWDVPSDVLFGVKLESEKINSLSLEVYESCDSWPFLVLKKPVLKVKQPVEEGDLGIDTENPNALESQITPRVGNKVYYFHVNLLSPGKDDAKIKYNLTISELYQEPPK